MTWLLEPSGVSGQNPSCARCPAAAARAWFSGWMRSRALRTIAGLGEHCSDAHTAASQRGLLPRRRDRRLNVRPRSPRVVIAEHLDHVVRLSRGEGLVHGRGLRECVRAVDLVVSGSQIPDEARDLRPPRCLSGKVGKVERNARRGVRCT